MEECLLLFDHKVRSIVFKSFFSPTRITVICITWVGLSLAFRQPTEQSSTSSALVASLAVDGAFDKLTYAENSCTHTADSPGSTNPWWRVDLGRAYYVSEVRVTNREDCCGDRLSNFTIRIGK